MMCHVVSGDAIYINNNDIYKIVMWLFYGDNTQ